ncbi:CAP domain-containing protein [Terracoccus sp. 273MFTsu3.1]|uniref:CAP domain-containing protein n=1 Tax=Terracoccus sp. 273MFTsu3.1 TaxID=1172188 RepID=UPI00036A4343|nr:CAP domain-containing protein [Terracoccus sp. 273MFTsu3.1]
MGRHTDPAAMGSRRAAVVTLTVSALLVGGGFAILHESGGLRPGHPSTPSTPSVPVVTPSSRVADATETGRTPSATSTTTPTASPTTAPTTGPTASPTASPEPSLTTRAPAPLVTVPTPTEDSLPRPSATSRPAPPPRAGVAQQVVALVNVERSRAGCGPVSANAALRRAAQGHSDDMASRDYFSHTSPDGVTFAERIRAAGYDGGAIAENIAAGQVSAQEVMRSWMASPGHRANILDCTYRDIGVGYATGGTYGTYWTQTFGG